MEFINAFKNAPIELVDYLIVAIDEDFDPFFEIAFFNAEDGWQVIKNRSNVYSSQTRKIKYVVAFASLPPVPDVQINIGDIKR